MSRQRKPFTDRERLIKAVVLSVISAGLSLGIMQGIGMEHGLVKWVNIGLIALLVGATFNLLLREWQK